MKRAITILIAAAALAGGCSMGDENPSAVLSTTEAGATARDGEGSAPAEEDARDEPTPCQEAGQLAAADEEFNLSACSSLAAFRSAYNAASDERVDRDDLIDLLVPLCEGNYTQLCEDVDTIVNPPTTTTTAPPAGTMENPIPAGTPIPGDDWTFTVVGFEAEVGGAVAAANQFNEAAPEGSQWVRMRIRATYEGKGSGSPSFALRFNLAGQSGATYDEGFVSGGIDPSTDPGLLSDQPATFPGGSVEGWVYYIISDADAAARLLGFAPNITYTDVPGGVGFFVVKA